MEQLNYKPPQMFTLFPAPGPLLALGDRADRVLSVTLFEPNGKSLKRLGKKAQTIVAAFAASAKANNINYRVFDSQATASWTAWEVLGAGVNGTRAPTTAGSARTSRGTAPDDDVRREAHVRPEPAQLRAGAQPRQADPEPALGGRLAQGRSGRRLAGSAQRAVDALVNGGRPGRAPGLSPDGAHPSGS